MSNTGVVTNVGATDKPDNIPISKYNEIVFRYEVEFKAPNDEKYKSRLKTKEYKNLLFYLDEENGEDIIGDEVPLYKSMNGWDIDVPPYYKRGNKLLYNFKRYMLNNDIYVFDELRKTYKLAFRYKLGVMFISTIMLFIIHYLLLLNISETIEAVLMIVSSLILFTLLLTAFYIIMNLFEYMFPQNKTY